MSTHEPHGPAEGAAQAAPAPAARATRLFTPRTRLAIAALLFVGALSYFAFLAWRSATVYYMTVAELEQAGPTREGRLVRVAGKLVDGTFSRAADGRNVSFQVSDDQGNVLPVAYSGEVGQIFFNEHSELILEGQYTHEHIFNTETLIVSCPSKYESLQDQGKQPPYQTETYNASGS
ncbi:MAG: cytochrome c maturation protein CcmE [Chloroflexi bacterium]|nr:cytochrome c maturation protein CcmE [Chloroflexota bacterium]